MNWTKLIPRNHSETNLRGALQCPPRRRLSPGTFLGVALLALACATGVRAAEDDLVPLPEIKQPPKSKQELARLYGSVAEWHGIWSASESEDVDKGEAVAYSLHKGFWSHGEFVLKPVPDRWNPGDGDFTWGGTGTVRAENSLVTSRWYKSNPTGSAENYTAGGTLPTEGGEFTIHLDQDYVSVTAGWANKPLAGNMDGFAVNQLGESDHYQYERKTFVPAANSAETPLYPLKELYIRGGPPPLGRRSPGVFQFQDSDVRYGFNYSSRLTLFPVYDDLEVEVTIKDYEKWRPLGSIKDPKTAGNSLVAHAVLKSKNPKLKTLPEVDHFTVELRETSREPGVCLNWPLGAKDDDYDLQLVDFSTISGPEQAKALAKWVQDWNMASGGDFDAAGRPTREMPKLTIGSVTADGQKMEVVGPPTDKDGRAFVDVAVESFDFGGRAELRVVCVLKDGREIIGLIKTDGGKSDLVWLPKMNGPGWIAESWRKEHDVEKLPDNDDEEKVEGQPMNGDGYTLYEEYRGWAVNGKHLEGDPKRKELFVLNKIGADAVGGIALFERASKIHVPARLRAAEISEDVRLMNGNRRAAPHRVEQHGVVVFSPPHTFAGDTGKGGGKTVGLTAHDAGFAFRPATTRYIQIEPRTMNSGTFQMGRSTSLFNLSERDAAFAYDRAVAHELLHAVGVDHHGEGETSNDVYFVAANDPNNPTRRVGFSTFLPKISDGDLRLDPGNPRQRTLRRNPIISLFWEDTKRNIAEELAPLFEQKLAAESARRTANPQGDDPGGRATKFPSYGKDAAYWSATDLYDRVSYLEPEFFIPMTVGKPGEADSGDELCLMRYYFANAYPIQGAEGAFYLVRPGPEANRAGRELCRHPAGTLHNASTNAPQSRFGDAAPGRGGCFAQICPNDAIPPRKL